MVNLALTLNLPMNFAQDKAVETLEGLFDLLIGKGEHTFAFPKVFELWRISGRISEIFQMEKVVNILNCTMNLSECRRQGEL
jgi:hypothetical protein